MCTVLLLTSLVPLSSKVSDIYMHPFPFKSDIYLAYLPNFVSIFVIGEYLENTYGINFAAGCLLVYVFRNIGSMPIFHVAVW